MNTFQSSYGIYDAVEFLSPYVEKQKMGITNEWLSGQVMSIVFTGQSVLYNIYSEEWGKVFESIQENRIKGLN